MYAAGFCMWQAVDNGLYPDSRGAIFLQQLTARAWWCDRVAYMLINVVLRCLSYFHITVKSKPFNTIRLGQNLAKTSNLTVAATTTVT